MKKQLRALVFSLTLAVCIFGSTAAFAEAPAAQPADKLPRDVTEVTGTEATLRNVKAVLTQYGSAFKITPCAVQPPADEVGAASPEGTVAVLQLCANYRDSSSVVNTSGHAFLCITNTTEAGLEVGGLTLAPGTALTIGTRGNNPEHSGIWYDLEGYNAYYLDNFYPNLYSMQVSLNAEQLAAVNAALETADKWSALNNCVSFAISVWNAVCSDKVDPCLPMPKSLTEVMARYEGKVTRDPAVPYDYIVYYGYPAVASTDFS